MRVRPLIVMESGESERLMRGVYEAGSARGFLPFASTLLSL